jgi:hypothetical protein
LFSASLVVWADAGIPRVAGVAVGVATDVVEPSPVGIEDNGSVVVEA